MHRMFSLGLRILMTPYWEARSGQRDGKITRVGLRVCCGKLFNLQLKEPNSRDALESREYFPLKWCGRKGLSYNLEKI